MVKNLPAMQEAWVRSQGWEDSPGKGNGNPLQYSCLENSTDRGAWQAYSPWDCKESDMTEWLTLVMILVMILVILVMILNDIQCCNHCLGFGFLLFFPCGSIMFSFIRRIGDREMNKVETVAVLVELISTGSWETMDKSNK